MNGENESPLSHPTIDVSENALRVARILDRLYPGKHVIFLIQPERKGEAWRIEIFAAAKIMERVLKEREA